MERLKNIPFLYTFSLVKISIKKPRSIMIIPCVNREWNFHIYFSMSSPTLQNYGASTFAKRKVRPGTPPYALTSWRNRRKGGLDIS